MDGNYPLSQSNEKNHTPFISFLVLQIKIINIEYNKCSPVRYHLSELTDNNLSVHVVHRASVNLNFDRKLNCFFLLSFVFTESGTVSLTVHRTNSNKMQRSTSVSVGPSTPIAQRGGITLPLPVDVSETHAVELNEL